MTTLHATLLAFSTFSAFGAAAAQEQAEWGAEESARSDLESALRMWQDGLYGGLLFYHDGKGPLAARLYESMEAAGSEAPRPAEWRVVSIDCPTDNACNATAVMRFTDEEAGGLRRYRLVRDPGQFWGLYSEQVLECPEGYRLQYQGICFHIADEQSNDPDIEIRSADPVVAE